jgi:hypothetical protein
MKHLEFDWRIDNPYESWDDYLIRKLKEEREYKCQKDQNVQSSQDN